MKLYESLEEFARLVTPKNCPVHKNTGHPSIWYFSAFTSENLFQVFPKTGGFFGIFSPKLALPVANRVAVLMRGDKK